MSEPGAWAFMRQICDALLLDPKYEERAKTMDRHLIQMRADKLAESRDAIEAGYVELQTGPVGDNW